MPVNGTKLQWISPPASRRLHRTCNLEQWVVLRSVRYSRRGHQGSLPGALKPRLQKESVLMTAGGPVKPDEDVSPYLRQPLRTLEQAQQDRKRRQSQIAVTKAKSARWADPPRRSLEAVDDVSVNLQTNSPELVGEEAELVGGPDYARVARAGGQGRVKRRHDRWRQFGSRMGGEMAVRTSRSGRRRCAMT
jgi:hypothetical protein